MTKFFLSVLISFAVLSVAAQSPYGNIRLEEKEDYKAAEAKVLEATRLLFSTKFDKDDLDRLYAMEFVVKWMTGTPDFTFEINEKFSRAFVGDADLLGMFMAAMVKFALENRDQSSDSRLVGVQAIKTLLEYSSKATNNLKQTGELKKMAAAHRKGELEKYLGI